MPTLTWIVVVIAGLGLAYIAALAFGGWRWSVATGDLGAQLDAGRVPATTSRYNGADIGGLPAPVQRYFQAVLTNGHPMVSAVTLTQSGLFNMSATAEQWKPFTATQHFTTAQPGFVWNANIALVPGVSLTGEASYITPQGEKPYFKGTIDTLAYEFAP